MRRSRPKMITGIILIVIGGLNASFGFLLLWLPTGGPGIVFLITALILISVGVTLVARSRGHFFSNPLGSSGKPTQMKGDDSFSYEGQKLSEDELKVESMPLDEAKGKKAYNTVNGIYIGVIVDENGDNWIIENSEGDKINNEKSSIAIK